MKMLLDGKWVDRNEKINVYDPYDDSLIDCVPKASKEDALLALDAAVKGFEISKKLTVYERSQILYKTAQYIEQRKDEFANIIARESSKTIKEARKETARCINTLTFSAEEAKRLNGETIPFDSFPGGENRVGYYYRFPIGVVLAITPFNDPLNLVAHKLGPAFAAGNSVILKPATITPLSAIKLAEALVESGLPPQCLQVITGYGSDIGPVLTESEKVRMISFTGGYDAGKEITKRAGIKKIGMELGSNSPVIVWKDTDLEYAVDSCVSGAFWAAGQNCIGVQRIYIHKDIYNDFKKSFVAKTKKYKIGNKLDDTTDMGPMIEASEATRVEQIIHEAIEEGATCLCGGIRTGALMEPTVMENVSEKSRAHTDEIFGPMVNLYSVSEMDEAIAKSNSLPFGLHAGIFTKDINLALKAAYELDCGGVMINESTDYRLDPMPFGGVKNSGLGREGIKFSLQEMTEPKVVCFTRY
jgi:glyceraldehyde-3-phosphate dehydrogenase (NADP+)